jgi:very-short-patch-repair endonuclease
MPYKCEICEKGFDSLWGLSSHNVNKHNIKPPETYIKYNLGGTPPSCKCGCGERPTFLGIKKGFRDFIRGHAAKIHNNWGHNPKALKKSRETQKKMYDSGELVVWNKGLTMEDERVRVNIERMLQNPERGVKISKALKGKKRPEHVLKILYETMKEYWSKPENREKQSLIQSNRISQFHYKNKTKLEENFESLLKRVGVKYVCQYTICGYNFDYYLPDYDIVIEVDGDFWHCNPTHYPDGPIYESQINTLINDTKKNIICEKSKNLILLRFWETDIKNNPNKIIDTILEHLK